MPHRPPRGGRHSAHARGALGPPLPTSAPLEARDLGEPFRGMDVTVLRPALLWGSAGLGAALVGVALMLWASSAAISAVVCGVAALALLLALDLYFTRKPPQWWVCPGGLVWQEGEASPSIATP